MKKLSSVQEYNLRDPSRLWKGSSYIAFQEQAAGLLLSSSSLSEVLPAFFHFLKKHIPVTSISFTKGTPELYNSSSLWCDENGIVSREQSRPLSKHKLEYAYAFRARYANGNHVFLVEKEEDPLAQQLLPDSRFSPPFLLFYASTQRDIIGNILLGFRRESPLTPTHINMLLSLWPILCFRMKCHFEMQRIDALIEITRRDTQNMGQNLHALRPEPIIGKSEDLRQLMAKASLLAPTDIPCMILGETGTGKELLARNIHALSKRRNKPFVAVNCAAIPVSLINSELFGHRRGAFTGAIREHRGYFEQADGGTLFLDEIGELPLEVQSCLLRVLQTGQIHHVGGEKNVNVNFRLLTATNRNPDDMIKAGLFRQDLYFRLNAASLTIPPLRQRKEDIPVLVDYYLRYMSIRMGVLPPLPAPRELERLISYSWPGNVRELINVITESLAFNQGEPLLFILGQEGVPQRDEKHAHILPSWQQKQTLYFQEALSRTRGKISGRGGAAALTGMHPNTLRSKLLKLHLLPTA